MKKRILLTLFVGCFTFGMYAQNIQLLGGTNSDNKFVNFATIELYKPTEHGALYYFTDFKMSKDGFTEAYTEISKYWNIGKIGALTGQYNAGMNKDFQIKPVYLAGISKGITIKSFSISLDLLYRYQTELDMRPGLPLFPNKYTWERQHGAQATIIFSQTIKNILISGYTDLWLGNHTNYYIFEPQAWYKFSKHVYVGIEWRASNYYLLGDYDNYFMFGLKWNLEN